MFRSPEIVSLPIADRRTSLTFYRDGLGFDPIGEPAEDGVPEPLPFALSDTAPDPRGDPCRIAHPALNINGGAVID